MPEVVVAGHLCVDLFPALAGTPSVLPGVLVEVGPLRTAPGGCVAGTGTALAALGVQVRLAARAGDDTLGQLLCASLASVGADTQGVQLRAGETTSYSLVLEPPGADRAFWHHVGANATFDGYDLDLHGASLIHLGYPSLLPALCADNGAAWEALLLRATELDITTSLDLAIVDPASDAARWDWAALLRRVLPLTGIMTPSADDVACVLGLPTPATIGEATASAAHLLRLGAAVVMLTCGELGLLLATGSRERLQRAGGALRDVEAAWCDQLLWVPSAEVELVTTTGAGDAAAAGLLAALLEGAGPEEAALGAARAAAARVAGRRLGDSEAIVLREAPAAAGWQALSSGALRRTATSRATPDPKPNAKANATSDLTSTVSS